MRRDCWPTLVARGRRALTPRVEDASRNGPPNFQGIETDMVVHVQLRQDVQVTLCSVLQSNGQRQLDGLCDWDEISAADTPV